MRLHIYSNFSICSQYRQPPPHVNYCSPFHSLIFYNLSGRWCCTTPPPPTTHNPPQPPTTPHFAKYAPALHALQSISTNFSLKCSDGIELRKFVAKLKVHNEIHKPVCKVTVAFDWLLSKAGYRRASFLWQVFMWQVLFARLCAQLWQFFLWQVHLFKS